MLFIAYGLYLLHQTRTSFLLFTKDEFELNLEELEKEEIICWDLITLAKSALYFYLISNMDGRTKGGKTYYILYEWLYIARLILNKYLSKEVICMLQLFYFCPDQVKIAGVKGALRNISSFSFSRLQMSPESLNNLLLLLDIDEFSRALLIKKTFKDKNFKQTVEFLTIYEQAVNKNLLLTETLLFYKKELKNQKLTFIQLQKEINQLFDLGRSDLETFEVFDIFESIEQAKSGSSKISFYSFYQDLLLSLIVDSNEEKDLSIKVFELFELFLYSAKNKTIFLIEIGFENGSSIQKFIVEFCKTHSRELKNLCGKDASKYGVSLTIYITAIVSLNIGMLLLIASRPFGLSKNSRSNPLFSRGQLSADVAFFYNDNEEIEESDQSKDLVIPSTQTEDLRANNKVRRSSNGSFASIMPRFSRKVPISVPKDQGLVQTTFSQSLQSSDSNRTSQFVENKVQQKRVVPTKTTLRSSPPKNATPTARVTNLQKKSRKSRNR